MLACLVGALGCVQRCLPALSPLCVLCWGSLLWADLICFINIYETTQISFSGHDINVGPMQTTRRSDEMGLFSVDLHSHLSPYLRK